MPHLAGTRNVHLQPGLSVQTLQKVEGQVSFAAPVDPKSVTFDTKETGKEKPVHDASVSLQSVSGKVVNLHFRGASENLLLVRAYGADGKPLAIESNQILPQKQDVDDNFTFTFKGPPAKVEVTVASNVIERFFPFSLARGAIAGPPSAASVGVTLPPRPRAAKVAATAPTTAPAAAPAAAPVAAPAPAPVVAPVKPKSTAARSEPKPNAEPKAQRAPARVATKSNEAPRPERGSRTAPAPAPMIPPPDRPPTPGPKFNDVMTAVLSSDPVAVTELLDMGRWVDKRDSNGLTPLMAAVQLRDAKVAQLLIRRGADVNARAGGGATPLAFARENGDAAMVELLQRSGAQ